MEAATGGSTRVEVVERKVKVIDEEKKTDRWLNTTSLSDNR